MGFYNYMEILHAHGIIDSSDGCVVIICITVFHTIEYDTMAFRIFASEDLLSITPIIVRVELK
jgi:hypothetical protein